MTVHYLHLSKAKPPQRRKQRAIEVVALLRDGQPLTAREIEERLDMTENNVRSTLKLLKEYGLIRFAGFKKRVAGAGSVGAMWEWV